MPKVSWLVIIIWTTSTGSFRAATSALKASLSLQAKANSTTLTVYFWKMEETEFLDNWIFGSLMETDRSARSYSMVLFQMQSILRWLFCFFFRANYTAPIIGVKRKFLWFVKNLWVLTLPCTCLSTGDSTVRLSLWTWDYLFVKKPI